MPVDRGLPLWYGSGMWQAYIGIVSPRGLAVFCPELPETVRFLQRRCERMPERSACFWCVVSDEAAWQVQRALRAGEPRTALRLLQLATRDGGPLLPAPEEPADEWVLRSDG